MYPLAPFSLVLCALTGLALTQPPLYAQSAIFIHPDGAGVTHWQAARFLIAGPDGDLNWDRLPHIAVYRGHLADNLTATSNSGAVAHAYGRRLQAASFGLDSDGNPPLTASGKAETLMEEAKRRGLKVGVINSGDIIEPGTAVYLARAERRKDYESIAKQVVESGAEVILSGGEQWLLPAGKQGRHGKGKRTDDIDLIKQAVGNGYTVVYTAEELAALPASTEKVLGVFAHGHMFHDEPDPILLANQTPLYLETAPTLAEMTSKALEILSSSRFFLVVEEEGTDNFGNANNARGTMEALRRADEAYGVALAFLEKNEQTLLITAADSSAGAMDVIGLGPDNPATLAIALNGRDSNAAPYGLDVIFDKAGKHQLVPFTSAPDAQGVRHPFVVIWGTLQDSSGGILVRAAGHGADRVRGSLHNVDIYHVIREVLFGDGEAGAE